MAVIAKQRYKLDIAPKGGWVIVYASQHDNGAREIEFEITNQGNAYSIPASINISVQGVKSNKGYFSHSCSYSGNIVKMALANDMTDVIGKAICVLKFTNSSQQKLATAKFILNVDSDSSSEGIIIDTEAEEIFNQMLNEIRAQAASVSADIAELQSMVGSPLVASTASAMTDHNKIYVYTGSQSGYTNGNWYYWNGSAWTSGGVYNSVAVNIDSIPTAGSTNAVQSGGVRSALDGLQSAIPVVDSVPTQGSNNAVSSGGVYSAIQTFGDTVDGEISDLETEIAQIVPGMSYEAKEALLACFRHVAWTDVHGRDYYDALESALYEDSTVIGINRGIGTSGTEIVTNEKRILSDPIPFTNTAPITVQVRLSNNSYAYNFKFTDINNKIILNDDIRTPFNNIGYFKNADNSITVDGWGTTADELTFKDNITNVATVLSTSSGGQVPNGYFRLLFANASDTSGVLPQEPISGYVMVQGKKYTLAEINRTIHITRGMGTSGTEIVSNEKRMLSDPISFANKVPITIQMLDSDGTYGYNIKFINTEDAIILSDNICNELGSTALFYDENNTSPTGGWIKDSKQYTLMAGTPLVVTDAHSKVVGEQFSGYLRVLYCNGADASGSLPVTAIPNKFIMQGLVYTLQES